MAVAAADIDREDEERHNYNYKKEIDNRNCIVDDNEAKGVIVMTVEVVSHYDDSDGDDFEEAVGLDTAMAALLL